MVFATVLLMSGCTDVIVGWERDRKASTPPASSDRADETAVAEGTETTRAGGRHGSGDAAQPRGTAGSTGDPETTSATTGVRGLTWTAEELAVWRKRSRNGPYRTKGDAGRNTPGDWQRITENAAEFAQSPAASQLVAGFDGCASQRNLGIDKPFGRDTRGAGGKFEHSVELRDAAFVALVENDAVLARMVIDQLLRQAREPTMDFTNSGKWCPVETNVVAFETNEFLFPLSSYLARLLFAYDYVARSASPAERATLDRWHRDAAAYIRNGVYRSDRLWKDAEAGDYTPTQGPSYRYPQWRGGRDTSRYGRHYNNRQATTVLYLTAVGVHLGDDALKRLGRRWAQEYLRYSVYPDGTVAELERGRADAERGMNYVNKTLSTVAMIADLLARYGDLSVYDYTTSEGIFGTTGGPKSLRSTMRAVDTMYDSSGRIATGGGDYGATDTKLGSDAAFAVAQRYYDDPVIGRLLTRAWPARPRHSWAEPWQGPWGLLPGALFQYHSLPAAAGDPYRSG